MSSREDLLFYKYDLRLVIEQQDERLKEEIGGYDRNYLLNTSSEDLCDYLENKYRIDAVVLHKDKIHIKNSGDADIDVSNDYNRMIFEREKPFYIKGTSITFSVPFEGDRELFYCKASTFTLNPSRASVGDNELLLTYNEVDPNPEPIKADFEKRLSDIETHLRYILNDITPFNNSLRAKTKQYIESTKSKILKDQGVVSALGYPMRTASNTPTTYIAPEIRKKVVIQRPTATTAPFTPEPVLDMENYEAILKIISNMVLVMERSPQSFKDMKEEDLRQHFLVQLNGHFEGEASGETFNYQGKTDILIRHQGKNIFIAECMFWKGQESLLEKINQLLGYTSWRDTKTAILIFNKSKDSSAVLAKIPEIVKIHKNFKRQLEYNCETGFRFVLSHNADKNRELILTISVFDVPQ